MRIIISGGGTGGHIFPAVAIANALRELDLNCEILFVGAEGRMEMQRVPAAGYKIEGLPVRGLIRPLWSPKNFGVMRDFLKSKRMVKKIIKEFKPDVAVGVGGYASAPTLNAAYSLGIPCLIQEQNSFAGVTNKSLAKKASKICVAYEGMERFFPKDKILLTGNPVRQNLVANYESQTKSCPSILIIGGSLGARTLNEAVLSNLGAIAASGVKITWQTGAYYKDSIAKELARCEELSKPTKPDNLTVTDFVSDMASAYAQADLVISRAGASSISELCLLGKPSILVPSPNVAEDHQTHNAMALVRERAALIVKDIDAREQLISLALETVKNKELLAELSANALKLAKTNSARVIAEEVIKLIKNQ